MTATRAVRRLVVVAALVPLFPLHPAAAAVVAVVSAKSAVTALSREQIADLFLGRAGRFPNGEQAVPIDQVETSAARDEFYRTYAGKLPAQVKAHWSKVIFTGRGQPPPEVSSDADVKKRIGADPHAIGYIEQNAVDSSVRVLAQQ